MEMSRTKNIIIWVLQALLAGLFLFSAIPKLTSMPEVVENFRRWGYPENFHLLIGALELLGGIGLLIPKTVTYAAIGLILIMIGAAITHLRAGEGSMALMPVLLVAMLSVVAYVRCPWATRYSALRGIEGHH